MSNVTQLGRREPPQQREPRIKMWGVHWPMSSSPTVMSTAPDMGFEPVLQGGDYWQPVSFIAARRTRADFTVAFRQPARPEYLALAANDRGDNS